MSARRGRAPRETPGPLDPARDLDLWWRAVALRDVGAVYAAFAEQRPALYDAMFTHAVDLPFANSGAPPALQEAFGELREAVRPLVRDDDLETLTETFWSGLHGLLTLMRNGRLRREDHERRLALLLSRFPR